MRPYSSSLEHPSASGATQLESSIFPSSSSSSSSALIRLYRRSVARSIDHFSCKAQPFKKSRLWRERKQTLETMGKLKRLVPTVPKNEQVTRMELLQHVIDYIFELQRQLSDPLTALEDREP